VSTEGISGSRENAGGVEKSGSGISIIDGAEPFWNWKISDHISLKALDSVNDGAGSGVSLKSGCHAVDIDAGRGASGGRGAFDAVEGRPFELGLHGQLTSTGVPRFLAVPQFLQVIYALVA
jgi:hypothetical protein